MKTAPCFSPPGMAAHTTLFLLGIPTRPWAPVFLCWLGAHSAGAGQGLPGGTHPPAPWPLMARYSLRELQNAPDTIPESGVEPPPLDTAWVEATRKKALLKLEKLDTDLKNYKGNSIKESIRCCSREAGRRVSRPTWPWAQVCSCLGPQARPR